MPLHKLSQWLAYSLIEPMQTAGFGVNDIDGLTGLAEYRNGAGLRDFRFLLIPNKCIFGVISLKYKIYYEYFIKRSYEIMKKYTY